MYVHIHTHTHIYTLVHSLPLALLRSRVVLQLPRVYIHRHVRRGFLFAAYLLGAAPRQSSSLSLLFSLFLSDLALALCGFLPL